MGLKTWDVLDRQTGEVLLSDIYTDRDTLSVLERWEVAYCRETGEVVYR